MLPPRRPSDSDGPHQPSGGSRGSLWGSSEQQIPAQPPTSISPSSGAPGWVESPGGWPSARPGWPPPRRRRVWMWLVPAIVVVVAAAVAIPLASSHGSALFTPGRGPAVAAGASFQPYAAPADGAGYSTQPLDQPTPLPGLRSADPCSWLPQVMPQLRTALDATGYAARADACHVILPSGEDIQIIVLGPYTEDLDAVRFMRPSTVDGLQGREFANSDQGSGECAVSVNVRAVLALDINSWNTDPAANNNATRRATSCRHAEQTADIIVRRFVPLVHGTPFPGACNNRPRRR
jgi:hypothetical protein